MVFIVYVSEGPSLCHGEDCRQSLCRMLLVLKLSWTVPVIAQVILACAIVVLVSLVIFIPICYVLYLAVTKMC